MNKDELKNMITDVVKEQIAPLMTVDRKNAGAIDVQVKDRQEPVEPGTNLARMIKVAAMAKRSRKDPKDIALSLYPKDEALIKAMSEESGEAGGYLVPPEFSKDLIEFLRAEAIVRRAQAPVLSMNSNVLNIPKITGGSSAFFIGENENIPATDVQVGQLQLTAKKLAALLPVSNDLLRDGGGEKMMSDDLVTSLAGAEDTNFLRGNGSQNSPKGILYAVNSANKFDANGTINLQNVMADLTKAIARVKKAKVRLTKPVWFFGTNVWQYLYTVQNGFGVPAFQSQMDSGKLLGYTFLESADIPENLGTGGDESEIYFGNAADFVIGQNMQLIIDINDSAAYYNGSSVVSAFSLDQTVIRVISRIDCGLRHDKAFSVIEKVKWGVEA